MKNFRVIATVFASIIAISTSSAWAVEAKRGTWHVISTMEQSFSVTDFDRLEHVPFPGLSGGECRINIRSQGGSLRPYISNYPFKEIFFFRSAKEEEVRGVRYSFVQVCFQENSNGEFQHASFDISPSSVNEGGWGSVVMPAEARQELKGKDCRFDVRIQTSGSGYTGVPVDYSYLDDSGVLSIKFPWNDYQEWNSQEFSTQMACSEKPPFDPAALYPVLRLLME